MGSSAADLALIPLPVLVRTIGRHDLDCAWKVVSDLGQQLHFSVKRYASILGNPLTKWSLGK